MNPLWYAKFEFVEYGKLRVTWNDGHGEQVKTYSGTIAGMLWLRLKDELKHIIGWSY